MATTKLKDMTDHDERTEALKSLITAVTARALQDCLDTVRDAGGTADDLAYAPLIVANDIVPVALRMLAKDGLLRSYHCTAAMSAAINIRDSILATIAKVGAQAIENDKRHEHPN